MIHTVCSLSLPLIRHVHAREQCSNAEPPATARKPARSLKTEEKPDQPPSDPVADPKPIGRTRGTARNPSANPTKPNLFSGTGLRALRSAALLKRGKRIGGRIGRDLPVSILNVAASARV